MNNLQIAATVASATKEEEIPMNNPIIAVTAAKLFEGLSALQFLHIVGNPDTNFDQSRDPDIYSRILVDGSDICVCLNISECLIVYDIHYPEWEDGELYVDYEQELFALEPLFFLEQLDKAVVAIAEHLTKNQGCRDAYSYYRWS